jgi:hypothetical protein
MLTRGSWMAAVGGGRPVDGCHPARAVIARPSAGPGPCCAVAVAFSKLLLESETLCA